MLFPAICRCVGRQDECRGWLVGTCLWHVSMACVPRLFMPDEETCRRHVPTCLKDYAGNIDAWDLQWGWA